MKQIQRQLQQGNSVKKQKQRELKELSLLKYGISSRVLVLYVVVGCVISH